MQRRLRTIAPILIMALLVFGAFLSTIIPVIAVASQKSGNDFSINLMDPHRVSRNVRWLQWWIEVMWR